MHTNLGKYGGAEKVCYNVIRTLVGHGQDVELLTLSFNPSRYLDTMGEEFPPGVLVHSTSERAEAGPPFTIYKKHHAIVKMLREFESDLRYDFLFDTHASSPFEPAVLTGGAKNIAYVHFPEIHYNYDHAGIRRKAYLWPFKRWVEQGVEKLDLVFCNSGYTKEMIERYWGGLGIRDPVVVYPPVRLDSYWCSQPLGNRKKRVTYVGRFIPAKRHDMMKRLATDLPAYEFVSVGGLAEGEREWFDEFSRDLPKNYALKANAPEEELTRILQESRVYAHMMTGEHFGISPIEALACGCIPLVPNSGGIVEFIPEEFRWKDYWELKQKIVMYTESTEENIEWENKRKQLWARVSSLGSDRFQTEIWSRIEPLI